MQRKIQNWKDDGSMTDDQIEAAEILKDTIEKAMNRTPKQGDWLFYFDDRQRKLIKNCQDYASRDPAGLPGHNLMMIISRMADLLNDVKLAPMD